MKKHILPLIATLLLGACTTEDDASEVILFVSPSSLTAGGGETIRFEIEARTRNERIARFEIGSFDAGGAKELFSAEPGMQSYEYTFFYQAPYFLADSTRIELTFRATDNIGQKQELHHNLTVLRSNSSPLPEKAGITLWSPHSGKPDGFSLTTAQPLLCATADDEQIDIYLYADPNTADPDLLTREWRTRTGVRFARANNFDYAAATETALRAVYANSVRHNYVRDLAIDDVILIGRETEVWGAIKIAGISDEAGAANDRYLFNIKMI